MSRHGHSVTRTTMKSATRAASAGQRSRISALGAEVRGRRIHLVGAKGTGMAALAEVLAARGALLSGADVAETFQTQEILDRLRLVPTVGFAAGDLPARVDWVVHSAAYDRADNPQLAAAAARGVPVSSYPEALGALSRAAHAVAVSGVHGKTTTAALCGLLVEALDLPATVLTATGVPNFGGGATLIRGAAYLVAETCEYRNHFAQLPSLPRGGDQRGVGARRRLPDPRRGGGRVYHVRLLAAGRRQPDLRRRRCGCCRGGGRRGCAPPRPGAAPLRRTGERCAARRRGYSGRRRHDVSARLPGRAGRAARRRPPQRAERGRGRSGGADPARRGGPRAGPLRAAGGGTRPGQLPRRQAPHRGDRPVLRGAGDRRLRPSSH